MVKKAYKKCLHNIVSDFLGTLCMAVDKKEKKKKKKRKRKRKRKKKTMQHNSTEPEVDEKRDTDARIPMFWDEKEVVRLDSGY